MEPHIEQYQHLEANLNTAFEYYRQMHLETQPTSPKSEDNMDHYFKFGEVDEKHRTVANFLGDVAMADCTHKPTITKMKKLVAKKLLLFSELFFKPYA